MYYYIYANTIKAVALPALMTPKPLLVIERWDL